MPCHHPRKAGDVPSAGDPGNGSNQGCPSARLRHHAQRAGGFQREDRCCPMSDNNHAGVTRRDFLGLGLKSAAAGVALAPGVMLFSVAEAKPAEEAASAKVRWGMLIDTSK